MLAGILFTLFTAGPSGYYVVTSRLRKTIPCGRCNAEGYVPIRRGSRLHRKCPRCGGAKRKLKYAAARNRRRRAMKTAKA
jgi:hypothetical protein